LIFDEEGGARSETNFPLRYWILKSSTHYNIKLEAPGLRTQDLNDTTVIVNTKNNRTINVTIHFKLPDVKQGEEIMNSRVRNAGIGTFSFKFPKDQRFESIPKKYDEKYRGSFMLLEDGILSISLQRELPEERSVTADVKQESAKDIKPTALPAK